MDLSTGAARSLALLEAAGYEAYAVGGCVRDYLMGRPVNDADVTTSALVGEVHAALEPAGARVLDTGAKHGTVTALFPEAPDDPVEITTFRIDGEYTDFRHPESVTFTRSLEEDLARRDYTINAMAYNPSRGIIDLHGGIEDIATHTIRCVGDPDTRFQEDALRIMRGLRLASQTGFTIHDSTFEGMLLNAPLLEEVSHERVGAEFTKLLCGEHVKRVLLDGIPIITVVIPQLEPLRGFKQNNAHHVYDVLEHTAVAVQSIPSRPILRYAALLHDIGKPATYQEDENGVGHFYGHEMYSVRLAQEVCEELRLPNSWTDEIGTIVAYHGAGLQPTERSMKRWLNRLGEQTLRDLLLMKKADVTALAPEYRSTAKMFDEMDAMVDDLIASEACFQMKDLAIDGNDLIELGYEPGQQLGDTLDQLLELVIDGEVPNDHAVLLDRAGAGSSWFQVGFGTGLGLSQTAKGKGQDA